MKITIQSPYSLNKVGGRSNNEDSIFPLTGKATPEDRLFLVCDGVGGAEKGEVASQLVCEAVSEYVQEHQVLFPDRSFFDRMLKHAEKKLSEHILAFPNCFGMKTTLTMLWITQRGIYIGWCGDSRVYQFRDGEVIYRTDDHSLVNEMVKRGELTEEEAQDHPHNNVILRAVAGMDEPSSMDVAFTDDVEAEDIFMLCTDGVTEELTDLQFAELSSLGDVELMGDQIDSFCGENSKDNYSLYLLQVTESIKEDPIPVEKAAATTPTEIIEGKKEEADENKTEEVLPPLELEDDPKEVEDPKENRLLKYILGGLACIAVLIGGLSFWEYQKSQDTKVFMDQALAWEEKEQLDSALYYLKIAAQKEPQNAVIQNSVQRIEGELSVIAAANKRQADHNKQIATLDRQLLALNQDTLTADSLKYQKIIRIQTQKALQQGEYAYHSGELEEAFTHLKFKEKSPYAQELIPPQTWTIMAELYRAYIPNDSIGNARALYCEGMAGR